MKKVKDLMLPLSEYAIVHLNDTVKYALLALDEAQSKLSPGQEPHRAVLVQDGHGNIVGKIGHLGFLKAFESKHGTSDDIDRLSRAGVAQEFVNSMENHSRFWQDDFALFCRRARSRKISEVMNPIIESIDENATLIEAAHRLLASQTLSILVSEDNKITGLLRLSDVFTFFAQSIKSE